MQFYSLLDLCLLAAMLLLYYTVFRDRQWFVLLGASIFFYVFFGNYFGVLVLATSFSIWLGGVLLNRFETSYKQQKKQEGLSRDDKKALKKRLQHKKRWVLAAELIINLGILAACKYMGLRFDNFILPLGISFYTFQALSYFFDIYNNKYGYEPNYFHFLLFCSWFPQMFQGPISRYNELGVQFFQKHEFKMENIKRAFLLFMFGAMKKYAIADALITTVDGFFGDGMQGQSGTMIFWGAVIATIQQYADFSGGIDMVLAISELFGIKVKDNFRQPYFAVTLADLWRRWHITLCDWCRDYIFYPFAVTKPMMKLVKWGTKHWGKIGRILPAVIDNVVVFAVVGVWHGTGWNYLVWGLYNGILMSISDILKPVFKKMNELFHIPVKSFGFRVFRIVRTWLVIGVGSLFTYFSTVPEAFKAMKAMVIRPDWKMIGVKAVLNANLINSSKLVPVFIVAAFIVLLVRSVLREKGVDIYASLMGKNVVLRWGVYYILIFLTAAAFVYLKAEGGFQYANF